MKLSDYTGLVNAYLNSAIALNNVKYKGLYDGMTYSLTAGGKRIRPVLRSVEEWFSMDENRIGRKPERKPDTNKT